MIFYANKNNVQMDVKIPNRIAWDRDLNEENNSFFMSKIPFQRHYHDSWVFFFFFFSKQS